MYQKLFSSEFQHLIRTFVSYIMSTRIAQLVEGKKAVGLKNVIYNELYFIGYFPLVTICAFCSSGPFTALAIILTTA